MTHMTFDFSYIFMIKGYVSLLLEHLNSFLTQFK